MKMIFRVFLQLFSDSDKLEVVKDERNFFDYSSSEKIKIMRAAGREAQKEQQKVLDAYEARFG